MPLSGLALVSKRNKPLLVVPVGGSPATSPEEERDRVVELHLTVHASLDVVDENAAAGPHAAGPYLGLLTLVGRHATFAYVGPTGVKAVAVADAEAEPVPRDAEMRAVLAALYQAYADWTCNPFVVGDGSDEDPVPTPESGGYVALARRLARISQMPVGA